MANTPPDRKHSPRPGSPPEAAQPPRRPDSVSESEWLAAIPELPTPESGKVPIIPSDADLDFASIFGSTNQEASPNSGWLTPTESVPGSAAPSEDGGGSDIFSVSRRKPPTAADPFRPAPHDSVSDNSDIFDSGSARPGALDHFLDGSVDRNVPADDGVASADGTTIRTDGLGSDDLFLSFDQPPSELFTNDDAQAIQGQFGDSSDAVNNLMDELHLPYPKPGGPRRARPGLPGAPSRGPATPGPDLDFSETAAGGSSSNLFADLTDDGGGPRSANSGVDLLNPDGDLDGPRTRPDPDGGPESSIFHKRTQGSSLVNMDQIPLMGSSDEPTEAMTYTGPDVDGTSSIFQRGTHPVPGGASDDASGVSFGSPSRHGRIASLGTGQSAADSDDASAAIDWALPGDLPPARGPAKFAAPGPAARGGSASDSEADLSGFDDDVHATPRMAPSSGIFEVELGKETPLGTLSGSYPAGLSRGSKSGFLVPPGVAPRSAVNPPLAAGPRSAVKPALSRTASKSKVVEPSVEPARKYRGGLAWLGGSAVGLLAGVAACSALYVSGVVPSGPDMGAAIPRSAAPVLALPPAAPAGDLADARRLLAAGQAELALPAFEAVGDSATPPDLAGRGLARWQVRVREMARTGKRVEADDKFLKPAIDDLERAVAAADEFKTPAERSALYQAVLGLGVTKELTGDFAGAAAYYAAAARKYPPARGLFESAASRVALMKAAGKVVLAPRDAAALAEAVAVAVTLLQADGPAAGAGADEPGLAFWEAANRAALGEYPAAIAAIKKSRAAHEVRRLLSAGRGPNPLTDPVEQIYLNCCDELAASWALRQQLYSDPVAGPAFAKSGVAAGLKQLALAAKPDPMVAAQLAAAQAELKAKEAELTAAAVKESQAAAKLTALTGEAAATAKTAADTLAAAAVKVKAADAAVAKVVSGLKAGKVVGQDDDAETVLKNLPAILKKVTSASDSADATKAADAVAAARAERDAAQVAAETMAAEAKKQLAKADADRVETQKRLDAARAEASQLRAAVEAERKKLDAAAALAAKTQLDEQRAAYEAKIDTLTRDMGRQAEDARLQMANARAGAVVPLMTSEVLAQGQAAGLFNRAIDLYFAGRYPEAEAALANATRQDGNDARYWYFLGLSRLAQGKAGAAEAFQKGAAQESRSLPPAREINAALEKVQGEARRALNGFRP